IAAYDREHGIVVLTADPPFDDVRRRDQRAVREYRASLADPKRTGYGLSIDLARDRWRVTLLGDAVPQARHESAGTRITVTTWAPPGESGIAQRWRIETSRPLRWTCRAPVLRRADYTQLTEGGPLPPSGHVARRWSFFGIDGERG